MKKVLPLFATLLTACGAGSDKNDTKAGWAGDERKEFMRSCISSAKRTYEERGQQPDSAVITCMCKSSGEMIEEKYTYTDADNISPDEVKRIMGVAAKKCLVK